MLDLTIEKYKKKSVSNGPSQPSEAMLAFTASLPYDRRLFREDIAGSRAHVRGLGRVGLLDEAEVSSILQALDQVEEELVHQRFAFVPSDEDIHTANERRLSELIGKDIGGKLHTGRSRNEQVATDMRLWLREELRTLEGYLVQLIKTSVQRAEAEIDVLVGSICYYSRHVYGD